MPLSEFLALASAACAAASVMLLGQASGRLGVFRSARLQLVTAFFGTLALALLGPGWHWPEPGQIAALLGSSCFGMVIGNLTYSATVQSIGPRLTALLFSLTAPFSLALGYLVLGETISLAQALGVGVVLAGVVMAIGPIRGGGQRLAPLGLVLGVVTALVQSMGTLLARPVMAAGVDPFVATAIRAGFAALVFAAATPFVPAGGEARPGWRAQVQVALSAVLGICLGMSLMMAALVQGSVGLVTTLAATVPVVILPMIWLVHRKAPGALAWCGAALSALGTAVIALAGG